MEIRMLLLLLTFGLIQMNIRIDEKFINKSLTDLDSSLTLIPLNMLNYEEFGMASYDYCTDPKTNFDLEFLGFEIKNLGIKVADDNKIKEVLIKISTYDLDIFYDKIVSIYGNPNATSLSKYYLEKNGFEIPINIDHDKLEDYYSKLPKPTQVDYPELLSLSWFGLNQDEKVNLQIRNKTNPLNFYQEKEVWIIFKKAK